MKLDRLLITGAAGGVGREMRGRLAPLATRLRLSDIAGLANPAPHEEIMPCDLADAAAVMRLVEGCDGILHLGGVSGEDQFSRILDANIRGVYNLYEAARAHGRPRIVFASSNHVVGFHRQDRRLDASAPMRPDGWYGISKCLGEMVASMYHDKFGQETAVVRIGSCFDRPRTLRMLSTWLSYDDFAALVGRVFAVPRLGCPVIWGVSDNDETWWDNAAAGWLGWRPQDSSRPWREELMRAPRPAPDAPEAVYQGGTFTADPVVPED